MLIRDFGPGDVEPACALTNHFIEHTAVHFGLRPHTPREFEEMWRAGRATHPWLAAEIDRAFAGYAKAGTWRTREAYARTAEVGVYIDPSFHRRGVGRALYGELLRRLQEAGFHTAVGGVTLPNEGSVRLHESMGFRYVGTFREAGWKFDAWHDTGWWQVMLDDTRG